MDMSIADVQSQMIQTCNEILRDKINLITAALALQGKVRRSMGYDPLAGALTQLAIMSRKMNAHDFDMKAWKTAVENADDRWWEWFDKRPNNLIVPLEAMNYAQRREDSLALREQLRQKYARVVEEPERVGEVERV